MTSPTPRPALRRAPDADIHPAAPGQVPIRQAPVGQAETPGQSARPGVAHLRRAGSEEQPTILPVPAAPEGEPHRLSGPLRGATSDSLRLAGRPTGKGGRKAAKGPKEKRVELTVRVPKSLRDDFRAALKADRRDPDEVVGALIRAWLGREV